MVSDGNEARLGTLTAGREWFKPWRTITGETLAGRHMTELQVMLEGVFDPGRFLALVRDFIVFDDDGSGALAKKMAGYHQFHAVRVAVDETLRAAALQRVGQERGAVRVGPEARRGPRRRRIGVVWPHPGRRKSLTLAFYTGAIVREPAMENPTVVVLTDRNDLDDQLFGTFSRCQDLLRQPPTQTESRADLRSKLSVNAGGVVFTTIQSSSGGEGRHASHAVDRRNIVVIADEAHRSQYDFIDGYARHMRDALPNASSWASPGRPSSCRTPTHEPCSATTSASMTSSAPSKTGPPCPSTTRARLAKLALDGAREAEDRPGLRGGHRGRGGGAQERLKTKWAQLEAVVGAEKRVKQVAEDIVNHFEQRLDALEGKAMVVCMSRRICIALYRELVRLRPDWHDDEDSSGAIKVVMTGAASDPLEWQPHIRNKARREALAQRFRDPNDPLRVVLVRDMWLTGFDAPSLHTMYVDKPMRGHGLMQAIARVNRVFKDKPGGLVVDYLGLAQDLRKAVATYTESGGTGRTAIDQAEAVAVMLEKYEVCCALFHGFDWSKWTTGTPQERLSMLPAAQEHVLAQEDSKERCLNAVRELSQAFALAVPHPETTRIRDDVGFFQAAAHRSIKAGPRRKLGRRRNWTWPCGRSSPELWRPRVSWTSSLPRG